MWQKVTLSPFPCILASLSLLWASLLPGGHSAPPALHPTCPPCRHPGLLLKPQSPPHSCAMSVRPWPCLPLSSLRWVTALGSPAFDPRRPLGQVRGLSALAGPARWRPGSTAITMVTGRGWEELAFWTGIRNWGAAHSWAKRGSHALPRQKTLIFHFRKSKVISRGLKINTHTNIALTTCHSQF